MKHMAVRPDLLTFNSVLKALRRCGHLSRVYAPQALSEMKALGIGDDELVVSALSQTDECLMSVSSPLIHAFSSQLGHLQPHLGHLQQIRYTWYWLWTWRGLSCLLTCLSSPGSSGLSNVDILQYLMSELDGCSFTCQDPHDSKVPSPGLSLHLVVLLSLLLFVLHSLLLLQRYADGKSGWFLL